MNRANVIIAGFLAGIVGWLGVCDAGIFAQPGVQIPVGPIKGPDAFHSKEGKSGWKVVLPGSRPLATPAIADGKLFLGGGFGSHEFYGFDAVTGKQLWLHRTGDDGPSAAVVDGDYIAFNTESCELEIITRAGKPVWKKWLGDPLMSMPAIHQGKVYMTYPDSKGDNKYRLACFELNGGKELWKQQIEAEVVTTPVIANDQVYLATLDGTLYCFEAAAGKLAWKEQKNATSSPAVADGKCYFSRRREIVSKDDDGKKKVQQTEQLAAREIGKSGDTRDFKDTARPADYLDIAKRSTYSANEKLYMKLDGSVGFASGGFAGGLGGIGGSISGSIGGISGAAGGLNTNQVQGLGTTPGKDAVAAKDKDKGQAGAPLSSAANAYAGYGGFTGGGYNALTLGPIGMLGNSNANIGQLSVAGIWSYQGSRPFVHDGRLFAAMGDTVKCVDLETRKVAWRKTIAAKKDGPLVDAALTPPAIANGKLFVGSAQGVLYCLSAEDGDILWQATIGEPIQFQPAVVRGRIYVATAQGSLVCVETGDRADDGWCMWGGGAAHNGPTQSR
jgi:outer membrane protein assembly factor BamB